MQWSVVYGKTASGASVPILVGDDGKIILAANVDIDSTEVANAIAAALADLSVDIDADTIAALDAQRKSTDQPVNPGYYKPASVNGASYQKLAVSSTSVGFAGWPASGQILVELTVETADVCMSLNEAATVNHPILRVGDTWIREVDAAQVAPKFVRVGGIDGEVRARFMQRA